METHFSKEQLKNKDNKSSEKILRKCVHCGFCNTTCPTYNLLGDELDGPRGRIYLIKDIIENNKPANEKIVKHIDRCLSCYSCMTTCPSGVNYMHLIDHGRKHIEKTYIRPFRERIIRNFLSFVLPNAFNFKYYLDWGGALIWLEVFELSEGMFQSIRKKVVKLGGYVTMIKNSNYLPYVEDIFTINRERFNISQSIKKSFDPKRILNPGKMYTGI